MLDGKYGGPVSSENIRTYLSEVSRTAIEREDTQRQLKAAAEVVRDQVSAGPDEEIIKRSDLFPAWSPNVTYTAGDIVRYGDKLYRVAQPHTSQADWLPGVALSLYTVVQIAQEGKTLPWAAGEAVAVGDLRVYGGVTYRCRQGHTTLTGWEPPGLPSLWEAV